MTHPSGATPKRCGAQHPRIALAFCILPAGHDTEQWHEAPNGHDRYSETITVTWSVSIEELIESLDGDPSDMTDNEGDNEDATDR